MRSRLNSTCLSIHKDREGLQATSKHARVPAIGDVAETQQDAQRETPLYDDVALESPAAPMSLGLVVRRDSPRTKTTTRAAGLQLKNAR